MQAGGPVERGLVERGLVERGLVEQCHRLLTCHPLRLTQKFGHHAAGVVRLELIFGSRTLGRDRYRLAGQRSAQRRFSIPYLGDLDCVSGWSVAACKMPPGRRREAIRATVSAWSNRRL